MRKSNDIPLYIIPIQEDGFHVFLELKVNGTKVFMLLDTGASRTVFDLETIKSIHKGIDLEENEDNATGLGTNSVKNFAAVIKKLEIGKIKLTDYEAGIIDLSHVNSSYKKIDIPAIAGVFGSDLLVAFNAVIDYKDKVLKLDKR